jgi:hypothetical protein
MFNFRVRLVSVAGPRGIPGGVDEVAELAHDHDGEKSAEEILRELLRVVQLVRAPWAST